MLSQFDAVVSLRHCSCWNWDKKFIVFDVKIEESSTCASESLARDLLFELRIKSSSSSNQAKGTSSIMSWAAFSLLQSGWLLES